MQYRDRYTTYVSRRAGYALPVLRIGLGMVILLAGAHKLVAPSAWTKYAGPWMTDTWPEALLSFETAMVLNGALEILFGLAILAGVYTAVAAGVVAVSMLAVVFELAIGAVMTGEHVDVLIRDIGLFALATGVTLLAAEREAPPQQ